MLNQTSRRCYRFLWPYIKRYRPLLTIGFLCVVLASLLQLLTPWILRYGIDFISNGSQPQDNLVYHFFVNHLDFVQPGHFLAGYAVLIIMVVGIEGSFRYLMRNLIIGISRRIEYDLRNAYFQHLQKLSQSFYHRHKTGDLMALASNDLEAIRSMLGPGLMHLVSTVLLAVVALWLMFRINWQLTLWSLVPLPFVAVVVNRLISRINKQFRRIQEQFAGITSKVQENLSGIRIIKAYVQEDQEIVQFKELNREMIRRNIDIAKTHATMHSSIELLLGLGIIALLAKGGGMAIERQISIGDLVAFLVYYNMLAWPMIAFGWVLNLWQQGLASTERVVEIFNLEPDIRNNEQTDFSISKINGDIEFVGVHFSYDRNEPPVLRGIDLKIAAGKTLAIVGPTGAGKSTLVNLIPRLIEPTQGQILVDGRDIRSLPLQLLRENIGYVPQETFLFSDTLRENIAYGICCPRIEEIEQATETSQIKVDLDQLPLGLDTMIGEKGITLSGGQKQRTAISRAVIRQPRFLILDDALSAVDTYTEEEILQRLKTVMQQRTTILVSHRVSTVRYADEIIVLQDGCITQRGKHHDLIQTPGYYRDLYKRQQLEKSLEQL
ncbi:MAG TPA: ABC transporter ATP-binding protein [bacterium]|nr:ABC transporter ATP-binding protein [bacterium]HPG45614.1 ABC transporter ATP-binding protein [bacterium]HPM97607.1 ABC transporter ATP-binding protein [bacterium]